MMHELKSQPAQLSRMTEQHTLELPPCCPVSKNPRPGSQITITYKPQGKVLEVGSLFAYIHSFKGGLRDENGNLLVRDMEGMVQRIAQDCAICVGTKVKVVADLQMVPRQRMRLEIEVVPEEINI
jgi:NADPH-dependent 7-cyano-7-deazaguanine reductase QueF